MLLAIIVIKSDNDRQITRPCMDYKRIMEALIYNIITQFFKTNWIFYVLIFLIAYGYVE